MMKDCLLLVLKCLLFLLQKCKTIVQIQERQAREIRKLKETISDLKFIFEVDE